MDFFLGAIAAASFVAGLFFVRFWLQTRDRFFVYFALSFWIETANRVAMMALSSPTEDSPIHYLVRLVAYGLILAAIIDKNRANR